MANIIIFTDRTPLNFNQNGTAYQIERYTRPAGVYKIASTLRKHGYSVIVIPNCLRLTFSAVKEFIANNSKDLLWVGLGTNFMTVRSNNLENYRQIWQDSTEQFVDMSVLHNTTFIQNISTQLAWANAEVDLLANYLKDTHNVKLVLGGSWITHIKNGALTLTTDNVHFITGYAEDYTLEFTNSIKNQQAIPFQLTSIEERDFKSSYIDYDVNDFILPQEWLGIEISRGCSFKCAYCTYDHKGKTDTTKHTKTLRDELLRNYEKWGITKYHLLDDLYNDSEYKIKLLYDEVWSKLPFQPEWISYLRLDLIWSNPETAKWLEASGCRMGHFGIETLHDKAGKKVGKGLGKQRTIETLEFLKETWGNRVLVTALMIAGLPHEPYDHIVETMSWLRETDLVFNYKYQALWITSPDHKEISLKLNDMSNDYEKYEVTWGPDGWINNMGITFKQISELTVSEDLKRHESSFLVDILEYTDLRSVGGYTHEEIANKEFNKQILEDISSGKYQINDKINNRLCQLLKITD